jgi:hypothetical protein
MMQPVSDLPANKATQRRHSVYEQVPWRILLGIGIGLNP